MRTSPMLKSQKMVTDLLSRAGITINGKGKADIQVHNQGFYQRVLRDGSLGVGESYMEGWWDVEELDTCVEKVLRADIYGKGLSPVFFLELWKAKILNQQSKLRSKRVAEQHYDLGNDLYEKMLDPRMQYTCAYWKKARNLNEAQEHKLDLICRKLHLTETDRVLELGCGWGGFARFAAEKYGCRVTAYNISKEQVAWGREKCRGLPVDIHLRDYREAQGIYHKVVAIGLCEHIGYKNYNSFLKLIHRCLADDGLALIHTIAGNKSTVTTDAWLDKYIFPGSMLPAPAQMAKCIDGRFVLEDWHNFGPDYDRTLMAWFENFDRNWQSIKSETYDDRFYRMWKYYLLMCAGSFRARKNQLWQIVLSKKGLSGGYESVR
ncbi:cyclopropane fatty acyl phospholipid synthase [Fibrobacterota bacterium]